MAKLRTEKNCKLSKLEGISWREDVRWKKKNSKRAREE
jgi:hypothetical protein